MFRQQLELAKELNKPASVHCVRAFGDLLEILKYDFLRLIVCTEAKVKFVGFIFSNVAKIMLLSLYSVFSYVV